MIDLSTGIASQMAISRINSGPKCGTGLSILAQRIRYERIGRHTLPRKAQRKVNQPELREVDITGRIIGGIAAGGVPCRREFDTVTIGMP
jgi:hypothetical protein